MWSKTFEECFDVIVKKPYFDIFTVETITVRRSMYRHYVDISLFIEFFFVRITVLSNGNCYFYFVYLDPSSRFLTRSKVDDVYLRRIDLLPFFVLPSSRLNSSKKHSLPTYYF